MMAHIIDFELHLNTSYTSINFSDHFLLFINFLIIIDGRTFKYNLYFSVHVHYVYIENYV